jgi:hypothetical protein
LIEISLSVSPVQDSKAGEPGASGYAPGHEGTSGQRDRDDKQVRDRDDRSTGDRNDKVGAKDRDDKRGKDLDEKVGAKDRDDKQVNRDDKLAIGMNGPRAAAEIEMLRSAGKTAMTNRLRIVTTNAIFAESIQIQATGPIASPGSGRGFFQELAEHRI